MQNDSRSGRKNIVRLAFLLAMSGIAVTTILFTGWTYSNTKRNVFTEMQNAASLLENYYNLTFYQRELSLKSTGERLLLFEGENMDSLRYTYAVEELKGYDDLLAFGLSDTAGQLITFTGFPFGQELPNLVNTEASRRSFLKTKQADGLVIGETYFFEGVNDWILPIRVPIRDSNGELLAVNTSAISISKMYESLQGFGVDPAFRILLRNKEFGTTQFFYPIDSIEYDTYLGKTDSLFSSKEDFFTDVQLGLSNTNEEIYLFAVDLTRLNHTLWVAVPVSHVYAQFFDILKIILFGFGALLLVFVIVFRFFRNFEKNSDAKLQKEKSFSLDIIKGTPALIVGVSTDGITQFVNPATVITTGYKESELLGQNWWKLLYPDEKYEQVGRLMKSLEKGQVKDYEMTIVTKDGKDRVISWNSLNILDRDGEISQVIGFGNDVTALKMAQLELQEYATNLEDLVDKRTDELQFSNHQLTERNEELNVKTEQLETTLEKLRGTQKQLVQSEKMASLGILSAGIGHEINNPLNFIKGGVTGLKNIIASKGNEADVDLERMIEVINEGVDRANRIVKSLSQFSRGGERFDEQCDINNVIENCLTILYNQYKGRIEVEKEYYRDTTCVVGNEGKVHQVMINILSNAIQALDGIDQPKIKIKTDVKGSKIHITIEDNGNGIDPSIRKQIFDPFFTTKDPGKGTGLGLAICTSIMDDHNGSIEVETEIGQFTRFIILFPCGNAK